MRVTVMVSSILILEDDPVRIKKFKSAFIGVHTVFFHDAKDAITYLHQTTPRVILLDYDLDSDPLRSEDPGCGQDVAFYISENALRFKKSTVVIHSLNRDGAKLMGNTLAEVKIHADSVPFLWRNEEQLEDLRKIVNSR
jgi:CheY-like chemotaxis protein